MAVSQIVLDRQASAKTFSFGTTSASGEGLVTINKGTAATSTVVLDVKGSQNIVGDLNLTGNLKVTGNIDTQSVTNTNVADVTITLNDGGSTPADDTAGIIMEGTSNTIVGALKYKAASATKWSVGSGATQVDIADISTAQAFTNKDLSGAGNTFPTLNQSTTGSAAKWTTARNLAGNSVDGSANVAFSNKFVVQGTTDTGLSGAQFLGALGTGIVKNTTTTGVLSIAANSDLPVMSATVGGAVPTPPNNTTTFLRGDGTFATPAGGTTHKSTAVTGTQDSANKVFTIANTLAAGSEQVFVNGQLLDSGATNDYVYNGTTTITFQAGFTAPAATDKIKVFGGY